MNTTFKKIIFAVAAFAVCALQASEGGVSGGGSAGAGGAGASKGSRSTLLNGEGVTVPWLSSFVSYFRLDKLKPEELFRCLAVNSDAFYHWIFKKSKEEVSAMSQDESLALCCRAIDELFSFNFPLRCILILVPRIMNHSNQRPCGGSDVERDGDEAQLTKELIDGLCEKFVHREGPFCCSNCERIGSFVGFFSLKPCCHCVCPRCARPLLIKGTFKLRPEKNCPVCYDRVCDIFKGFYLK